MATAITKTQCSMCNETQDIFECKHCSQIFCFYHIPDHRETIGKQLNRIEDNPKSLQGEIIKVENALNNAVQELKQIRQGVLENGEVIKLGALEELNCNGHHCIKCSKCHDWYYTGDLQSWQWIRNCKNWPINDWNRYDNGRLWERFKRRNNATCRSYYGHGFGLHYLACLCADNICEDQNERK